jgi:glycosyltransferase involved in cell wall biosynthesis
MLIKWADDSQRDLEALEGLGSRPGLPAAVKRRIAQEIRLTKGGIKGEKDAAYEIDFHYRESPKVAVIHDLRLELGARVAQIDHLLVNRFLDIWVCETKHFSGVGVNAKGEWVASRGGRLVGIPSPIEQNERHISVLKEVFMRRLVPLPERLGIQPIVQSLILVSGDGLVYRPEGRVVDGLDRVIKVDQLVPTIARDIETMKAARLVISAGLWVGKKGLEEFAWKLAALHQPRTTDWAAKVGLDEEASGKPPRVPVVRCALCERTVTAGEVDYCQDQRERFSGRILCYTCQHT